MVANSYLGEHIAKRTAAYTSKIREKRSMNYGDYSYIEWYDNGGPANQPGYLMDLMSYGRKDYIKEMEGLLAKLTREDVNNVIKKYLQVSNMDIAIATDVSEAEPFAEALGNTEYSPMSYSNFAKENLPKEILAEDEEAANYKLNITQLIL